MALYDKFDGKGDSIIGPGTMLGLGIGGTIAGSALSTFAKGGTGTLASTVAHYLPAIGVGAGVIGAGIGAMYLMQHQQSDAGTGNDLLRRSGVGQPISHAPGVPQLGR
jgi:hypothetical protein